MLITAGVVARATNIPSYSSIQIEPDEMSRGNNNNNNNNNDSCLSDSLHSSLNPEDDGNDDILNFENDDSNNDTTSNNNHPQQQQQQQQQQTPKQLPQLSIIAASFALMKGNLGPGILNLPHAFSKIRTSTSVSSSSRYDVTTITTIVLFALVTIQGLYSMTLLVYCKNTINQYYHYQNLTRNRNSPTRRSTLSQLQQHRLQLQQQPQSVTAAAASAAAVSVVVVPVVSTYMDVTKVTFGRVGERITEILIVVVQIGVCCVFMSLISTNLQVLLTANHIPITPFVSISIITTFLIVTVTVFRYIHDLFYFNAIANSFMFIAIFTVTITSIVIIVQQNKSNNNDHFISSTATIDNMVGVIHTQQQQQRKDSESQNSSSSSSSSTIMYLLQASITFIADLFFAFEGIGLVLPVENNYNCDNNHAIAHSNGSSHNQQAQPQPLHQRTGSTGSYNCNNDPAAVSTTQMTTLRTTTFGTQQQEQRNNTNHLNYDSGDDDDDDYHPHDHYTQQQRRRHYRWSFTSVLLMSMGCVAVLFAIIGFVSSIAFRDVNGDGTGIQNASITAFLQETYPNVLWYSIINVMVVMAVAMTFPLQLTPAMEVIEKWLSEWNSCAMCTCNFRQFLRTKYTYYHPRFFRTATSISRIDSDDNMVMQTMGHNTDGNGNVLNGTANTTTATAVYDYTTPPDIDMMFEQQRLSLSPTRPLLSRFSLWNQYGWMIRRWIVVLSCSTIVLVVNDLGLLVSLFGAVGQTGLAAMPCAVHIALQYQHPYIASKNIFLTIADVLVLIFCAIVMVAGCYLSMRDIVNKSR